MEKRNLRLLELSLLNMPECLYKQDPEYASGPKYANILNMAKFWIWQGSQYASIAQRPEYAKMRKYDKVLYMRRDANGRVLNIPGFRVCQVSAYANIVQGSEYAWVRLNNALWQGSEYAWSTFQISLK